MSLNNSIQCEKCQSIFRQILRMNSTWTPSQNNAPDFIREIMATEQCDTFFDLSAFRHGFVKIVTQDGIDRIQKYECNEQDKTRARYAMMHYDHYTKKHLTKSLSWSNWFGHKIVDRYNHWLGIDGFLG